MADEAPAAPAGLVAAFPPDECNLTVAMVGWSARLGRCAARAFASGDGFRPAEMLRDHGFSPVPVWGGPRRRRTG